MSVLQIASRTLSEEEILNRLKSLAGVIKVDNKEKKFAQNKEKVVQFIKRKKLSGEQEKLVFAVLKEFGFLNKG
jgi:ABC-type hemin transport system substrate-binding protein